MSITPVTNPASGNYAQQVQPVQKKNAPDGDAPTVEAAESPATKASEAAHGGAAPKTVTPRTAAASSNTNNPSKLKMFANQHMTASQIAERLGISVSAVMKEAASAGIKLSTNSTGVSNSAGAANPAIGNNVDVKA
jgi:hypothetical protein